MNHNMRKMFSEQQIADLSDKQIEKKIQDGTVSNLHCYQATGKVTDTDDNIKSFTAYLISNNELEIDEGGLSISNFLVQEMLLHDNDGNYQAINPNVTLDEDTLILLDDGFNFETIRVDNIEWESLSKII